VQRSGIALDLAVELEALAAREDGDAVNRRIGPETRMASPGWTVRRGEIDPRRDEADAEV